MFRLRWRRHSQFILSFVRIFLRLFPIREINVPITGNTSKLNSVNCGFKRIKKQAYQSAWTENSQDTQGFPEYCFLLRQRHWTFSTSNLPFFVLKKGYRKCKNLSVHSSSKVFCYSNTIKYKKVSSKITDNIPQKESNSGNNTKPKQDI